MDTERALTEANEFIEQHAAENPEAVREVRAHYADILAESVSLQLGVRLDAVTCLICGVDAPFGICDDKAACDARVKDWKPTGLTPPGPDAGE